jgi:1,4-alpha-glucan branching enzyme
VQTLVRDLNNLYRANPALYETDCFAEGFYWIDCHDSDNSVISYVRRGRNPEDFVVVLCNFTPVVRNGYRIGVPRDGRYHEILNTDAGCYNGSGVGNGGQIYAEHVGAHGQPYSLNLVIPPLAALILKPEAPPAPVEAKPEAEQAGEETATATSDDQAAGDAAQPD